MNKLSKIIMFFLITISIFGMEDIKKFNFKEITDQKFINEIFPFEFSKKKNYTGKLNYDDAIKYSEIRKNKVISKAIDMGWSVIDIEYFLDGGSKLYHLIKRVDGKNKNEFYEIGMYYGLGMRPSEKDGVYCLTELKIGLIKYKLERNEEGLVDFNIKDIKYSEYISSLMN